jgi:hypothetical protein
LPSNSHQPTKSTSIKIASATSNYRNLKDSLFLAETNLQLTVKTTGSTPPAIKMEAYLFVAQNQILTNQNL